MRPVILREGLNIIQAERTDESSHLDSRNGLGKSTLLEIIHFCLGGRLTKDSKLAKRALEDWEFYLDISLNGYSFTISRSISLSSVVKISTPDKGWPIQPRFDEKTNEYIYTIPTWNQLLGFLIFGLPSEKGDEKYLPSFRSCISYFGRRETHAFEHPFAHSSKQATWDQLINSLFLLNLNWEISRNWQIIKDQKKALKDLKDAFKSGILNEKLSKDESEIENKVADLSKQIHETELNLSSFKVHPQYVEIESESNRTTAEIHELTNQNISDGDLIKYYQSGLTEDVEISAESVIKMYKEAQVKVPEMVTRRLEEVEDFHRKIRQNRKDQVKKEIESIRKKVSDRGSKINELISKRAQYMDILSSHGALDEQIRLKNLLQSFYIELYKNKNHLDNLHAMLETKNRLDLETAQTQNAAFMEHESFAEYRLHLINLFTSNSRFLYNVPGKFSINLDKGEYKLKIEIDIKDGSLGREKMKTLCYDLLLSELHSANNTGPGFLFHDSPILSDVDERQRTLAIILCHEKSIECGFQYILCVNSDNIPKASLLSRGFDVNNFTSHWLKDDQPKNSLLGIWY